MNMVREHPSVQRPDGDGYGSPSTGDGDEMINSNDDDWPTSSGSNDDDDDDDDWSLPQDRPEGKDVSDDVGTTAAPPDDCEEGCSAPASIDDIKDTTESQPLCRQPSSFITKEPPESEDPCLPEDTFSFLIIYTHLRSRAVYLAAVVFLFQMAIYALLAGDIIKRSDKINPFKFPVNVEMPVRIAEFLAIVVAIITQDDLRLGVSSLLEGFDQDLPKEFPGATKLKWNVSNVLRAIEGAFGMFLTFLLIMQSSTVVEVLLNFLAIEFVSQLDDVVFVLTREGFFGRILQKEAKKVSNTFYDVSKLSEESTSAESTCTCRKTYSGALVGLFVALAFIAGWSVIIVKQKNGAYLCQHIFVQFGDEVVPMLGTFTGLFDRQEEEIGNRLTYRDNQDGGALLAYCLDEERWTLSLTEDCVSPEDWNECACKKWIAASDESVDFDVLKTAYSQWVVKDAAKGILPLSQHFLTCHDHMHIKNLCGKHGNLTIGDEDDLNNCKCKRGRYGLRCEYIFMEPCRRLEIAPGPEFIKRDGNSSSYFAPTYYRMEDVEAYNRPVFTSLLGNDQDQDEDVNLGENDVTLGGDQVLSDETDIDIIIFTGVRWILSYKSLFPGLKDINVNDVSEMAKYFSNFHGHFTNYSAVYVSEPVYVSETLYIDIDSQNSNSAEASPSNLKWQYSSALAAFQEGTSDQRLQPDLENGSAKTKFLCKDDDSVKIPSDNMEGPSDSGGLIVGVLAAAVLLLGAYYVCRKRKSAGAEMDEAQFEDLSPAAEEEDAA